MKAIRLFAIMAVACLSILSSCKKEGKNPSADNGIKIEIQECNPFSEYIYLLYDIQVPENITDYSMVAIAVSNEDSIKDLNNWVNLNSTRADIIEVLTEKSNKIALQPVTVGTTYMVVVAVLDQQSKFIKISKPSTVTIPAAE